MFRKGNLCLVGWLYFFIMFGLNALLPPWAGAENSWVENIQLLVLAAGFFYCLQNYRKISPLLPEPNKYFWWGWCIYFFLLFMREISWGRTLFTKPNGSFYHYSDMGIYGQLVHPLVALFILAMLIAFWKGHIFSYLQTVKIPLLPLFLFCCFVGMQWLAEHHKLACFAGDLAEELAETGAYALMIYMLGDSLKYYRSVK